MWLIVILLMLLALLVTSGVMVLYRAARWQTSTAALQTRLRAARMQTGTTTFDPRALDGLPAPVQRCVRTVLQDGQPPIAAVTMTHTGTFNVSPVAERWQPFTSRQYVVTRRPGFVWEARIRMAPGVRVWVRDAYVMGEAILMARLFGIFPVMTQPTTPELLQGELMRFLAESAWYPTVLLPGQGVHWEAINGTSARATLRNGTTEVSLTFDFDDEGRIGAVRSAGRYRLHNGEPVATPWEGRFWDYAVRHGVWIPLAGEAAWLLPEGPKPYWRGRIQRIDYELAL